MSSDKTLKAIEQVVKNIVAPKFMSKVDDTHVEQALSLIDRLIEKHSHQTIHDGTVNFIVNRVVLALDKAIDYGDGPIARWVDSVDQVVVRAIIKSIVKQRLK